MSLALIKENIAIDPEIQNIIPPLTTEEYEQLEANVVAEGCRDALIVWGNTLIDGHNRYKICTNHNIPYITISKNFNNKEAVIEWVILNQFGRRNLSAYDRSLLALKLKPLIAEKAIEKQKESGGAVPQKSAKPSIDTRAELAKIAGVSHDTINKVERIEEKAIPEIKESLSKGNISIHSAAELTSHSEEIQKTAIEKINSGEVKSAKEAIQQIKKEKRKEDIQQQIEQIEAGKVQLPEGKFEAIVIDPPWNYGTAYDAGGRRVANPYPEMTQEELKKLEIPSADNSVIFLWTTHKFIWDAKELLKHWGFTYRNIIVWDKEQMGMGDLFRMQCEFCLVGIKGKPLLNNTNTFRDIITEKRREHSRKPEIFYKTVETLCIGRKLDYFSRAKREGWASFGNDTQKFGENYVAEEKRS